MSSPLAPPRSATVPGRAIATLVVVAAALVVAFVVGPPLIPGGYGDEAQLATAVRGAFVGYWNSGGPDLTPDLARIVDYWFTYHLAKVALAALLLVVLVALGVVLHKALRGAARAVSIAVLALVGLTALTAVLANAQGLATPFGSLFPLLVDGPPDAPLAAVLEQARQGLTDGATPPALRVMIDEFAGYHVAMAVMAAVVAAVLSGAGVALWTRTRLLSVFTVLVALAALVLMAANVTVAADAPPALLALLQGGW
jgi:hypothetical protein